MRRNRWRRLISAAAVAAVVLGGVAGAQAVGAQPGGSPSRAPAALGTGVVDPAVEPYLDPDMLHAVPVGPGDVSQPVQTVLDSPAVTTALDGSGIPEVALQAYQRAAAILPSAAFRSMAGEVSRSSATPTAASSTQTRTSTGP